MPESCISFLLDDRLSASQMCSGCCKLLRGEQARGRWGTVHKKVNYIYNQLLRQHTVETYKHHTLLVPQLKQPTTIPLIMEKRGRMNKDSAIESHFS